MSATPTSLAPKANGRYVEHELVPLQASVTKTATFTGAAWDLGSYGTARLDLNVSAASGTTPSMTVTVNTSPDGTNWTSLGSFTAATAVTTQHKVFAGCDRYLQAVATITGTTPSFTYDISGSAV